MKEKLSFDVDSFKSFEAFPAKTSLGQHIFTYLRTSILNGDVVPGSRLVENKVAQALGISRTPVREALHKLEREGLAKQIPQGGYAVTGLTREEIEDIFGIRSLLESYASRVACARYKEDHLAALEKKHEEAKRFVTQGRLDDLARVNAEFHDALYSMSGRPKLIEIINNLQSQIQRFRSIILTDENNARISMDMHRKLLQALKKRDEDRVEKLMKEHILHGQRIVLKALEKRTGEF